MNSYSEGFPSSLKNLIEEFRLIEEKSRELNESLTEEQANWCPGDKRWSILECLSHLNISGRLYLQNIDKAIENNPANPSDKGRRIKFGFVAKYIFIRQLEPPVKYKLRAPNKFKPIEVSSKEDAFQEFFTIQKKFIEKIQTASTLDFTKIKISSPVNKFIRISLYDAFGINVAHERRHIWQIEQIKKSANFPQKN